MIGYLEGRIFAKHGDGLVLQVGGVGYVIKLGGVALKGLTVGGQIALYIHTYVRDGAWELYGFATEPELQLFEMLLGVSGVGPKTALNVVDLGVSRVKNAVYKADIALLGQVPRLGKKNAQKIIIELKTKLGSAVELNLNESSQDELTDALTAMGFTREEAYRAGVDIPRDLTLSQRVKLALKAKT